MILCHCEEEIPTRFYRSRWSFLFQGRAKVQSFAVIVHSIIDDVAVRMFLVKMPDNDKLGVFDAHSDWTTFQRELARKGVTVRKKFRRGSTEVDGLSYFKDGQIPCQDAGQ